MEEVSISKMRYGWSKYGGANYGIAKQTGTTGNLMLGLDDNVWYCQLCGKEQTRELPNYLFSLDDSKRDFIRVCTKCKFEAIEKKVKSYRELIKLTPEEKEQDFDLPTVEPDKILDSFTRISVAFDKLAKKDLKGCDERCDRRTIEEYLLCIEFLEQVADEKITRNVADLASELLSRLTLIQ